jgi:hypothetical protein
MVQVMLNLKLAPEAHEPVYLTPVDFAARAIVTLSGRDDVRLETHHIVAHEIASVDDLLAAAETVSGETLRRIDRGEWAKLLSQQAGGDDVRSISPYLVAYPEFASIGQDPNESLTKFPKVSVDLTNGRLRECGVTGGAMATALKKYISHLPGVSSAKQRSSASVEEVN